MANHLLLAWQFYRDEKGHRYQRFVNWIQIILSVFIITLGLTSASVQQYLNDNLNNLLGADLVLSQQRTLSESEYATLTNMSQQSVLTQSLNTTLTNGQQWQRATLKAVPDDYPLQGNLRAATSLSAPDTMQTRGPQQGEIWLDARLLAGLRLAVGDTLHITRKALIVTKILLHEPDRLMQGHSVEMRALMHQEDFLTLGFADDLVEHRYLVAASKTQIQDILTWQKTALPAATVFHKQGVHPLALFWQRTENFIGLTSIILFFMAAIAMQQLTRLKLKKEHFFSAICQSLGASQNQVLKLSFLKWGFQMLVMLAMAVIFSILAHWLAVFWLSDTFSGLNWQPDIHTLLSRAMFMLLLFALFQLPIWFALRQSNVLRLILNRLSVMQQGLSTLSVCAVLLLVVLVYSDNFLLTSMLLLAMLACITLILLLCWGGLTLGEVITRTRSGLFPFALFMMKQRLMTKSTQVLGMGLCAFLLLFTLMFLRDLGSNLEAHHRQNDGNLVVSQASNEQMQYIQRWALQNDIEVRQQKPFVRAKLAAINGLRLEDFTQTPSETLATFQRAVRLHWTDAVPDNNRLISGQWWSTKPENWQVISVEQEVLTDLGLEIGDRFSFVIAEQIIEFTIVASHAYRPGKGSITFWVQMPDEAIQHIVAPQYSMASLELAASQFTQLGDLWKEHPTLRMSSLQEITQRFDTMLNMVTQVVSGFTLVILVLSIIVILSSVYASENRERKKNSVIMSFGFDRKTCWQLSLIEWFVTGLIAATGAIAGTWLAGWLIYQSQFSLPWQPDLLWLSATLLTIMALVLTTGGLASRNSISTSISQLMAEQ